MNLKKLVITSASAIALMGVSVEIVNQNNGSEIVEAKTTTKKLTHNAKIYTVKGKATKKTSLKKGKKVKILGTKTIKGKKYYKIGKNKYVKLLILKR